MANTIIREDKSYLSDVDLVSIEKGIAELGIYSIRIGAYFTEEQKKENSEMAKLLSKEEWSERCERHKTETAEKVEKIVDAIHDNFVIYQYKNKEIDYSKDDWDLFFWCNYGDMSYVRLNPNKKRTNQKQIEGIYNVLELIKTIECEGIDVAIQYTAKYNEEKVNEIVKNVYDKIEKTFVNYRGITGKIKEIFRDNEVVKYGFFKKGARKTYYEVSNEYFLQLAFTGKIA